MHNSASSNWSERCESIGVDYSDCIQVKLSDSRNAVKSSKGILPLMTSSSGTAIFAVLSLLLICTIHVVSSQNGCTGSGSCLPSPEDIAGKFAVTSNSTCGDPVEQYCVGADCSKVCNANDNGLKHPANYTNDAFSLKTFWKSKNYEFPVYLQIDTGALFMLYQSVITFQHELPAAMYLAKSKDFGATFSEVAFFSSDCRAFFNMEETPDNKRNGLKVECFKIDPVLNSNKQVSVFRLSFFSIEVYEPNSFTVYMLLCRCSVDEVPFLSHLK